MLFQSIVGLIVFIGLSVATLFDPSPAFPVPSWSNGAKDLRHAFDDIETKLKELAAKSEYDAASFSVAVTSETETLWDYFHTARKRNESRPGVDHVDGDSLYRIASVTKTFTVLGLLYQHQTGRLELDSPISKFIPELSGDIPVSKRMGKKDKSENVVAMWICVKHFLLTIPMVV
jgi:CubicO group peptidase (beta-lactamase class C family)